MTTQTSSLDVEQLGARYLAITAEIERLVDEGNAVKEALRTRLAIGSHVAGALRINIGEPVARFDAEHAARVIPPELLPHVTRTVVDSKLARDVLAPALYRMCRVVPLGAERRVLVGLVEP